MSTQENKPTNSFIVQWNLIQHDVHKVAVNHGFWYHHMAVSSKTVIAEKLCLIHSEISEGLEAIRNDIEGNGNLGEELADAVIRIMDLSEKYHLRVAEELVLKVEKNKTREFKHGKQL